MRGVAIVQIAEADLVIVRWGQWFRYWSSPDRQQAELTGRG